MTAKQTAADFVKIYAEKYRGVSEGHNLYRYVQALSMHLLDIQSREDTSSGKRNTLSEPTLVTRENIKTITEEVLSDYVYVDGVTAAVVTYGSGRYVLHYNLEARYARWFKMGIIASALPIHKEDLAAGTPAKECAGNPFCREFNIFGDVAGIYASFVVKDGGTTVTEAYTTKLLLSSVDKVISDSGDKLFSINRRGMKSPVNPSSPWAKQTSSFIEMLKKTALLRLGKTIPIVNCNQ